MLPFPREVVKSVAVYHLDASNDYPESADATIDGALLPMDRHAHALEGGEFANPFELYVDSGADVRVGDKLVISSANYYVKHVFVAQFGGLRHKRCSLSTEK